MKVREYDDGDSLWRVACDCGSTDHDAQLWFEPVDKDHTDISLSLSIEVGFYNRYYNWWDNFKRRVYAASKILFTGYYTMTGDVILDEHGMKAMKLALENGQKHAKACRENWEKKLKDKNENKNT